MDTVNTKETVIVKSKVNVKNVVILLVSLFLMTIFSKVVPPFGPVTEKGVAVLGIFVGVIILIVSGFGLMWPSVLSLCALAWTGYAPAGTLVSSLLGNATIIQLIFIMAVAAGMVSSGTATVIAKKMITSRIAKKSPLLFTISLMLGFMCVGSIVTSTAAVLFAFPLIDSITDVQGYRRDEEYPRFLILGCHMAIVLGLAIFPHNMIISSIVATFNGLLKDTGYVFSYGLHIVVALIIDIVYIILFALAMKYIFRVDDSKTKAFEAHKVEGMSKEECTFTTAQRIFLFAFLIGLLQPLAVMILPATNGIRIWLEKFSLPLWFGLILVVLSNIKLKGKRIFVPEVVFKEGVQWHIVLPVGALLLLGGALSSKDTGIQAWLSLLIGPLVHNMSWPLFVLLAISLCSVITNFFSNMATGVIVATIMCPFAAGYMSQGINTQVLLVGMTIGSMTAYLTPAAFTTAPILLARDSVTSKWIWTKGVSALILEILLTTALVSVLGYVL